jgi:uncharacterized protein (DUF736 family)
MAISGQQKAILPELQLPNITVFEDGTFGYSVRYRIVSEDANKFSQYSSIYRVRPNYIFERPQGLAQEALDVSTGGPYVNIQWDAISIKDRISGTLIRTAQEYDIFLQWGQNETNPEPVWVFGGSVETTRAGFRYPSSYTLENGNIETATPNSLSVEVFLRSTSPSRDNTSLLVYSVYNQTV